MLHHGPCRKRTQEPPVLVDLTESKGERACSQFQEAPIGKVCKFFELSLA